jgi:hypothetical protein
LGGYPSIFAAHSEDGDMYSVSFQLGGKKLWWGIPVCQRDSFVDVTKNIFKEEYKSCENFYRHKTILIEPDFLREKSIDVFEVCNKLFYISLLIH